MTTQQEGAGAAGTQGGDTGAAAGAAAAGAAAASVWYGSEGNKAVVETKGFKAVDDVFAWGSNLEKLLGADRAGRTVVLPKDETDVEGVKAFRAKLGVPESAAQYPIPDALKADPMIAGFAEQAHALGVPSKAFEAMVTWAAKTGADQEAAFQAQQKAESEKQLGELKAKWGGEFDKNAEFARRFAKSSGVTDDQVQAIEGAIGTRAMLELFHTWGAKTGEAGFGGGAEGAGAQAGGGFAPSKQAVQQQINELKAKRIAGQINERDFHAEMGRLGPMLEAAA